MDSEPWHPQNSWANTHEKRRKSHNSWADTHKNYRNYLVHISEPIKCSQASSSAARPIGTLGELNKDKFVKFFGKKRRSPGNLRIVGWYLRKTAETVNSYFSAHKMLLSIVRRHRAYWTLSCSLWMSLWIFSGKIGSEPR